VSCFGEVAVAGETAKVAVAVVEPSAFEAVSV